MSGGSIPRCGHFEYTKKPRPPRARDCRPVSRLNRTEAKENVHCNFPSCQICKSRLHSAVKEFFHVKLGRFTSKIFKVKKSVRLRQLAQTSAST